VDKYHLGFSFLIISNKLVEKTNLHRVIEFLKKSFLPISVNQGRFITATVSSFCVKKGSAFLTAVTMSLLIVSMLHPVYAAQLNWDAKTFETAQHPKFTFQRTVFIDYKDGGVIADSLRGKELVITATADSSTPGIQQLIDEINANLLRAQSSAHVTDVKLEYRASMVGRGDFASVDYRVIMTPTLAGFIVREYSEGTPALIDMAWRGIKIDRPIILTTANHGDFDVNQPLSFFKSNFPEVAAQISGTQAEAILSAGLIDSSGIGNQPLTNWHFLFDPTGISADTERFGFSGARVVVSSFTMGESSFREGQVREKEFHATFTGDRNYSVRTVEAGDAGNIFLAGYASPDRLQNHEVVGVSPTAPTSAATTSTGSFPVFIIYGMAGMAAAGAAGFFVWSSKKAKRESEYIQTGIDPKYLRAVSTSEASGGYHTVRGEAELATDDQAYKQHESVYGQENESLPKDSDAGDSQPSPSRGAMPKGWKPS
jgi:hypothetical protein